jgi:hypothetical protein
LNPFTRELAVARFAAVVFIEILALLICFLPLARASEQWQRDCRSIGIAASVITLGFCAFVLALQGATPPKSDEVKVVRLLEWGITTTYILNVFFLLLATVRTGGPTSSLYGTLIPVQLSAMLFLQLQKDRLTGKSSVFTATLYVAIGLAGYLIAYYWRTQIMSWVPLFTADLAPVDYAEQNAPWAAWLTVLAMLLSFATYVVPSDERFISRIRSWYSRGSSTSTQQSVENK